MNVRTDTTNKQDSDTKLRASVKQISQVTASHNLVQKLLHYSTARQNLLYCQSK